MKLCRVENLKGGEILSKDVMTSDVRVLLSEGTELRPEYIDKINRLELQKFILKKKKRFLHKKLLF